jgi:hypothetical protein
VGGEGVGRHRVVHHSEWVGNMVVVWAIEDLCD